MGEPDEGFTSADWDEYLEGEAEDFAKQEELEDDEIGFDD